MLIKLKIHTQNNDLIFFLSVFYVQIWEKIFILREKQRFLVIIFVF